MKQLDIVTRGRFEESAELGRIMLDVGNGTLVLRTVLKCVYGLSPVYNLFLKRGRIHILNLIF